MKKVLILKLASLGDLVHTLPALSDAARAHPGIQFDWVVDKSFHEIPLLHPNVNKVILTNHRNWRKSPFSYESRKGLKAVLKKIKETSYDCVIDAHGGFKTALLSLAIKSPVFGWDSSSIPEWGAHFFYTKGHKTSKSLHAIERARDLFAKALCYEKPNSEPDYQINQERLLKPSFSLPFPYVLFVPITSVENKLWKEEAWKKCAEQTLERGYTVCIPWGNLQEKERAERLAISPNIVVLPKLSLFEVGYVISKCKAMLSLDTGLSHMAASLNIPNVTLYGPTNPNLIGTTGKNQKWIQTSSLEDLSFKDVLKAFLPLLEKREL